MRTVNELLDEYWKALDLAQPTKEESEAAICAIALAAPIFIRLLGDIRDAIKEKEVSDGSDKDTEV